MAQPYIGETYKVRASTPMAVTENTGYFVWHTFMAERSKMYVYDCFTEILPASSEFRGQGGNFMSAQFSRLNVAGGETFQGRITEAPIYVQENQFY